MSYTQKASPSNCCQTAIRIPLLPNVTNKQRFRDRTFLQGVIFLNGQIMNNNLTMDNIPLENDKSGRRAANPV